MDQNLAGDLVSALRAAGINFITYLPETRLSEIIPLLQGDSAFKMVPVELLIPASIKISSTRYVLILFLGITGIW